MRQIFYAVVSDNGELLPTTVRNKLGEAESAAMLTEPWRYSTQRHLFQIVRVTITVSDEIVSHQPFAALAKSLVSQHPPTNR
jgi:hypothetical protein